jgi:hypothetical protein
MVWSVVIGGQTFSNANVDGTAYADEVTGFPAIIAAMANEAAFLKGVGNTSTTSMTPGTGTKTLTLDQTPGFSVGMLAAAQSVSNPTHYIVGSVAAINGADIDIAVTIASGGTAKSDWVLTYPVPGTITDGNGDLAISTGSIWTTASDADWNAGGNRTFIDMSAGEGRIGTAHGGGGATTLGVYVDGMLYLRLSGGAVEVKQPFAITRMGSEARTTVKQWLDQTEDLAIGGTLDGGWAQGDISGAADTAVSPSGDTNADKITATGGSVSHYIHARRGSINGTYGDIYTFAVYLKAGASDRASIELTADTYNDGAYYSVDLSTGVEVTSGIYNQGILVAKSITSVGNGWYLLRLSVDMSDVASAVGFIARIKVLNGAGVEVYTPNGGDPESLYAWGAMVHGGSAMQPYIPNHAATGQTYGFEVDADSWDAQSHTLITDLAVNVAGDTVGGSDWRVVKLELVQGGIGGFDFSLLFNHSTTAVKQMNTRPDLTAQAPGVKTRVLLEILSSELRVWYEEIA